MLCALGLVFLRKLIGSYTSGTPKASFVNLPGLMEALAYNNSSYTAVHSAQRVMNVLVNSSKISLNDSMIRRLRRSSSRFPQGKGHPNNHHCHRAKIHKLPVSEIHAYFLIKPLPQQLISLGSTPNERAAQIGIPHHNSRVIRAFPPLESLLMFASGRLFGRNGFVRSVTF